MDSGEGELSSADKKTLAFGLVGVIYIQHRVLKTVSMRRAYRASATQLHIHI